MGAKEKQDEKIARALQRGLSPNTSEDIARRLAEEETKVEPPSVPQPLKMSPASLRVLQAFVERAVKEGPKPPRRVVYEPRVGSPNTPAKPKTSDD